jgi:hypothetical protein
MKTNKKPCQVHWRCAENVLGRNVYKNKFRSERCGQHRRHSPSPRATSSKRSRGKRPVRRGKGENRSWGYGRVERGKPRRRGRATYDIPTLQYTVLKEQDIFTFLFYSKTLISQIPVCHVRMMAHCWMTFMWKQYRVIFSKGRSLSHVATWSKSYA